MSFIDEPLPSKIAGVGFVSTPRFRTSIQVSSGGGERRNQEWVHPLHRFSLPEGIARDWDVISDLADHFRIMRGALHSFPLRDPLDFGSKRGPRPNVIPSVTRTDQALGTGDGFTDMFTLQKTYTVGSESYSRPIHLPVLASILVADNGILVDSANYTVSRPGGVIQFVDPPLAGHTLTWGGLFDVEVRYESDDVLDQILRATRVAGFADLPLIEVRPC